MAESMTLEAEREAQARVHAVAYATDLKLKHEALIFAGFTDEQALTILGHFVNAHTQVAAQLAAEHG